MALLLHGIMVVIPRRESGGIHMILGDEAVALGALHAGVLAAYAYPGTPSTEILEYLIRHASQEGRPKASWCANEKTAFEQALGVSFAGRRALVCMKHVGLNVAADPFINSAIVSLEGGLVVAVADDPGMHSSQNEQDSRFYSDFAHVICLEPADHQEAYDMTREGFDLSERFHIPVVVRLVTRLAHGRAEIILRDGQTGRPPHKPRDRRGWVLLPGNARRLWRRLLERQVEMLAYSEASGYNRFTPGDPDAELGVITAGDARSYYLESLPENGPRPHHLHLGVYPLPEARIRELATRVKRILVLEDGYPYIERRIRGILPVACEIQGRESGQVPIDGELTPDITRQALGLRAHGGVVIPGLTLPTRPPQLCDGCPHRDTFEALRGALADFDEPTVTSDIGCYTLGALPPYSAIESCVCMGASVGMAKGASEAGLTPVVAVIGDSTFLHSGVTPLMDAVAAGTDMTLIILDNGTVAMTGMQPTLLPSAHLESLILGLGVDPSHFHVIDAHPAKIAQMTEVIRTEVVHKGLSVIICRRECVESARRRKGAQRRKAS